MGLVGLTLKNPWMLIRSHKKEICHLKISQRCSSKYNAGKKMCRLFHLINSTGV